MKSLMIPLENNDLFEPNALDIAIWESAYPYIDIHEQLRIIAAWNHSNPRRRKTHTGICRHINNWLAKENAKVLEGLTNGSKARLNVHDWDRQALRCQ